MPPKKAHRKEVRKGAANSKKAAAAKPAPRRRAPSTTGSRKVTAPLDLVDDGALSVGSGSVDSVEVGDLEVVAATAGPNYMQVASDDEDDDDSVIMYTADGGLVGFDPADFAADFDDDDSTDPFVRFASDAGAMGGQDLGALGFATRCPSCTVVVAIDADEAAQAAACVDPTTCFDTFRLRCRSCDTVYCAKCGATPYHDDKTCDTAAERKHVLHTCRYCDANIVPAIEQAPAAESPARGKKKAAKKKSKDKPRTAGYPVDCCDGEKCRALADENPTCRGVVDGCGHPCYAHANDRCDMCLVTGCKDAAGMNVLENTTAEELCGVCFTDELRYAPCAAFPCGHAFHVDCIKQRLDARWPGHRITLDYMSCPMCGATAIGPDGAVNGNRSLTEMLKPHIAFRKRVKERVLARAKFEGVVTVAADAEGADCDANESLFKAAMRKLAFYECCKCRDPYFGGFRQCDVAVVVAEGGADDDDSDREAADRNRDKLICGGCSAGGDVRRCRTHGTDYIEFKCKFCCSLATFFCFGSVHFCNPCHRRWEDLHDPPVPVCPATTGGRCPLGVPSHPRNGTTDSVALGCALCRDKAQL